MKGRRGQMKGRDGHTGCTCGRRWAASTQMIRNAERPGLRSFRSSGSHLGPFLRVLNPCVKESALGPTSSGRTRYTAMDKGEFPRSSGISVHFGFGITYLWHAVSRLRSCLLLLPHFTDILYFLLVDKYLQVFTPVSLSGECKYKKNNQFLYWQVDV